VKGQPFIFESLWCMRTTLFLFLLILLGSCSMESDDPGPIGGNFLEKVRYLKLEIIDFPKDPTLIANGQNSIKFTIAQYDKDKKFLFRNIPFNTVIRINGQDQLRSPFVFSTSVAGPYTFSIDGISSERLLEPFVELKAIAPKDYPAVTMPVIFHYIADPVISVSTAYLKGLIDFHIDAMNKAYANGDGSSDPSAVDTRIQFEPAQRDPEGNLLETPGLTIIRSAKFKFKNSEDDDLQDLIWDGNFWSPRRYINVWISEFEEPYSWARFPFLGNSSSEFPTSAFGVFFKLSMFTETRIKSVMIHEAGHLFNLFHNFTSRCGGDLDECEDTYDYQREFDKPYSGGIVRASCENFEFTSTNYMDYYPSRFNTFTFQQRERMQRTLALCPFLPTPRNRGRQGGPGRSHLMMPRQVDPSKVIW